MNHASWCIYKYGPNELVFTGFLHHVKKRSASLEGHYLINWPTVCTPKDLGWTGDPGRRLSRVLRLRWFWFQWKHEERPWVGLDIPCDNSDKEFFHASTVVTVGNSKKANFWHSAWVNGSSPKNLAPLLFKKSKRKIFTVYRGLRDNY